MIYLDWAASAPPDREILSVMEETALQLYGNPSSIHAMGVKAADALEEARRNLAGDLGCESDELFFTSGGSESNNLILTSVLNSIRKPPRDKPNIVISGIEHDSAFAPAAGLARWGIEVRTAKASSNGTVDPVQIAELLDGSTRLVSIMLVNNETGAIQPISRIAKLIRDCSQKHGRRILFHTDTVQALGKIPMDLSALDVDAASFSAHKIRGPRGAGGFYLKRGVSLESLHKGGDQEAGLRPGTENLPGITGFCLAVMKGLASMAEELERARKRMRALIEELMNIENVKLIPAERGDPKAPDYSPYILKISVPPVPGEVLVRVLGEQGVLVSTGSACSSKKVKNRYRVLENMGVSKADVNSCIRISQGPTTTDLEMGMLIEALKEELPSLVSLSR